MLGANRARIICVVCEALEPNLELNARYCKKGTPDASVAPLQLYNTRILRPIYLNLSHSGTYDAA